MEAHDEETDLKQANSMVELGEVNEEEEEEAAGGNEAEKEMIPATDDLKAGQSHRGQHKTHYS